MIYFFNGTVKEKIKRGYRIKSENLYIIYIKFCEGNGKVEMERGRLRRKEESGEGKRKVEKERGRWRRKEEG